MFTCEHRVILCCGVHNLFIYNGLRRRHRTWIVGHFGCIRYARNTCNTFITNVLWDVTRVVYGFGNHMFTYYLKRYITTSYTQGERRFFEIGRPKIREVDGAQKDINRQIVRWVYRAGKGKVFRVRDRRRGQLAGPVSEGSQPEISSRDTAFAGFLPVAPRALGRPCSPARTLLYL